ncbi:MAG: redoxin domain-containing protein [Pirellulales bacterium]|nr:redoxin domain-containing protein [Pirellulales bacterium]
MDPLQRPNLAAVLRISFPLLLATAFTVPASTGCKKPQSPSQPQEAPAVEPSAPQSPPGQPRAPAAPDPQAADAGLQPPKPGQPAPKAILESLVAAYRGATSYADQGTVRIQASLGDQKVDQALDYSVALVRPNKLRLQVYQAVAVSDGQQLWAFTQELPKQVLKRPAPEKLAFKDILSDEMFASALTQGPTQPFSWVPVQLLLLWADEPLKTVLYQAQDPVLLGTGTIDARECYRVDVTRPEGKSVLWIDAESSVLRRIELPAEELGRAIGGGQPLNNVSLVVDFNNAQLNTEVNGDTFKDAFKFETPPEEVETVEHLAPTAVRMLGKPAPDFKFVDLEGNEVTPKSLEGKIAVLDFWATWCGPCRMSLPLVDKIYQQNKDNDKVKFLAVSVDDPNVTDQQLRDTFAELKVNLPIGRDPEQHVGRSFQTTSIPAMFLLGPTGLVQHSEAGVRPAMDAELAGLLTELLAGRDVYSQTLARVDQQRNQYKEFIEGWLAKGVFVPPINEQKIPEAKIGEKTQPTAFTLTALWKNTELKEAGNILVVPRKDQPPKIFVLNGWKKVAELGPDGKVAATHPLEIGDREAASFLRTATDGAGKRRFAASGSMQQRVHVFDEAWKRLSSFPENALEYPHTGIADVQIADLQGDGALELCLGYWGVNGAQAASLEGKLLWSNKSIDTVLRVAVLGPDPQGKRDVACTNNRGTLVVLDPDGKPKPQGGELQLAGKMFHWIVAADLDGQEPLELCGLSARDLGVSEAVGVNLKGERLWDYALPNGVHQRPIELIVPGQMKSSLPGQWLFPAADGSIHVVAADGKPIDHFNYGVALDGLATAQIDGQPALLVSSAQGVEAFRVTWPGQ